MCELCTVRAVLGRELGHPGDRWLLQLERMRVLDSLHNWSTGTNQLYQSRIRQLRRFEAAHPGLCLFVPQDQLAPASGPEIGLMWALLHASVQPLVFRGRSSRTTPTFDTIRSLRSAASQVYGWDLISSNSGTDWYFQDRRLIQGSVRPTDSASFELFTRGMAARIGTQATPSTALLGRHIRGLDTYFNSQYLAAPAGISRYNLALAGFANLLLWLSWLRGGEAFSLTWSDVTIIWPHEGPQHDIPDGIGALLLRLLPETKSSRATTADVPIALRTVTGLDLHRWLRRVLQEHRQAPVGHDRVFRSRDGHRWNSHTYRTQYLYPGLLYLRAAGDTFLQTIGNVRGNSIPDRFYSIHSYRRGARTHSQRSNRHRLHRKATNPQVDEHARWRTKRSSQPLRIQYSEWTLYERLRITAYSH